ncbi:MAG: PhoH family protein, partial [Oscillibacter sp.]|nr:PhoH family protein [Oscillibacter sp.]
QIDLPEGKLSGLKDAMRVLKNVEGIGICELTDADVVRHVMVQRIVQAYAEYEKRHGAEYREARPETDRRPTRPQGIRRTPGRGRR